MENAQRWSVTYTKHVKQKRKVYQDGYLELQSSRHKVMIYDEWDKILESRFVKKDDVIKSGETLAFDSYLVDIGEQCGIQKHTSALNGQEKEKDKKAVESLHGHESGTRRPTFGKNRARGINLSPSQKIIREFKRSEISKSGSSPSFSDMTKTSMTEWQVLYTTQVTQKAKKFHDGFLQLVVRGSQGRQVMLYDITRRHLNSRFLKEDEIICSGESLSFNAHLVEIGEQEGDPKPVIDLTLRGKNCKVVGNTYITNSQAKIPTRNTQSKSCPEEVIDLRDSSSKVDKANLSCRTPANEPKRSVRDILSVLKKPILGETVSLNKELMEHPESHASDADPYTKDCRKGYAGECNGIVQEELRENKFRSLKSEAVEVLNATERCSDPESTRESRATSSSFCLRSGATNCATPILNVDCSVHNKLISKSSLVEPHVPVNPALGPKSQLPIESATLIRSRKNEEPENPPEILSSEEVTTATTAAATNGSRPSKLPKVYEDKETVSGCREANSSAAAAGVSNDCTSNDPFGVEEETNEFPSFDLGF